MLYIAMVFKIIGSVIFTFHKCLRAGYCTSRSYTSGSYTVFASYRSLLDVLGQSSIEELENIIPKVNKKSISKDASLSTTDVCNINAFSVLADRS